MARGRPPEVSTDTFARSAPPIPAGSYAHASRFAPAAGRGALGTRAVCRHHAIAAPFEPPPGTEAAGANLRRGRLVGDRSAVVAAAAAACAATDTLWRKVRTSTVAILAQATHGANADLQAFLR